jgi:hypothetical protein
VAEKLFSIRCETCGSRLAVRDANLIGHILSCPKCSSMVMVQPPEDWTPPGEGGPATAASSSGPPGDSAATPPSASSASASTVAPPETGLPPTSASEAATLRDRWSEAAGVTPPPAVDPEAAAADVPLQGEDWMSPRERWMRRYLPKFGAAVAGVAATVGLWYAFSPNDPPLAETQAASEDPDERKTDEPLDVPWADETANLDASAAPRAPEPDDPAEGTQATVTRRDVPISVPTAPEPPPVAHASDDGGNDGDIDNASEAPATAEAPVRPLRDPLPVIDVAARLNDPILRLDYLRTPLTEFLHVLSAMSTIPVTIDIDALAEAGISPVAPVTLSVPKKTVSEALELTLSKLKLRYVVVDQHIVVTTAEPDAVAPPARREIGDLVGGEPDAAERLAKVIERLIDPLSWRTQRTTTTLRVDGTALVVVQSPRTMRKIDGLLAAILAARRDPLGAAVSPPPALQTRRAAARLALAKKITLNYTAPTPLEKVVDRLAESSKLTILVDWQALATEDVGPATLARMSATDVTVEQAFAALVDPLLLAFRAIDDTTFEITTQDAVAGKAELAAHPAADLASDAAAYAAIVQKLRGQFGPSVVDEQAAGGGSGVAWYVDEPSKTLFVLAPQDLQVALAAYLDELRKSRRG